MPSTKDRAFRQVVNLTNELKRRNRIATSLAKQTEANDKAKRKAQEQLALAKVAEAGLRVGGTYRVIPKENAEDVRVGKIRRIVPSRWGNSGDIDIFLLIPAEGRFKERVTCLKFGRYDFEKVKGAVNASTP
jgi:hypothetical protein